jgi:urea transport system permease protein
VSATCGARWSVPCPLGIVNKLLEPLAGAVLGKILVLVGIILFIQARPRGLFALKGRAIEH